MTTRCSYKFHVTLVSYETEIDKCKNMTSWFSGRASRSRQVRVGAAA